MSHGDLNTGFDNSGSTNTGLWNSGDVNTGFGATTNTGLINSGFGNTGTGSPGFFRDRRAPAPPSVKCTTRHAN